MKKEMYWKVYQDKDSTKLSYYVCDNATIENTIQDWLEEAEDMGELPPVIEPVFMTKQAFEDLPEFEGY